MTRNKGHLPVLALAALVCLAGLTLFACAPQNPAEGAEAQKEVQFLDSRSFDRKLSASLAMNQPQVDVLFPAVITLNNIPERMDKWLNMVEKFGGKVQIQAEAERGIITEVFSIFIKAFEAAEEKLLYAPAKDYNVLVAYKPATGIITKMTFVRKAEAPAPVVKPAAPTKSPLEPAGGY